MEKINRYESENTSWTKADYYEKTVEFFGVNFLAPVLVAFKNPEGDSIIYIVRIVKKLENGNIVVKDEIKDEKKSHIVNVDLLLTVNEKHDYVLDDSSYKLGHYTTQILNIGKDLVKLPGACIEIDGEKKFVSNGEYWIQIND